MPTGVRRRRWWKRGRGGGSRRELCLKAALSNLIFHTSPVVKLPLSEERSCFLLFPLKYLSRSLAPQAFTGWHRARRRAPAASPEGSSCSGVSARRGGRGHGEGGAPCFVPAPHVAAVLHLGPLQPQNPVASRTRRCGGRLLPRNEVLPLGAGGRPLPGHSPSRGGGWRGPGCDRGGRMA